MLFHFEKDSNNYPDSTYLWHAPLIFTHIMHIYGRVSAKAILNKRKYPKYYSNQVSKHFDNQKRVFKGVVFCTPPSRDFIPPKSPVLIGLNGYSCLHWSNMKNHIFLNSLLMRNWKDLFWMRRKEQVKVAFDVNGKKMWKKFNTFCPCVVL